MKRRTFLGGGAVVLATAPAALAQQAAKIPRVGVLLTGHPPPAHTEAFRQGMRDLGYIEGKTVVIEWRWAEGSRERLTELAVELVRLRSDIIVTGGTQAARAAKQATTIIPIVMATGGDPVGAGLVATLARPGGNVTGLSSLAHGIVRKQVELLKDAAPKVSRVAILSNPDNPAHANQLREADSAATTLKAELQVVEARQPAEFENAFLTMAKQRAEGLVVLADNVFASYAAKLTDLASKSRLLAIYPLAEHAEIGGFMAYGASRRELYRRAAVYVDKILKGASPADLPVEQPTKFELVINLRTARALGLTIPPSLLLRADQIIE